MRFSPVVLAGLALSLAVPAHAQHRELAATYDAAELSGLSLEIPVAELIVEGHSERKIEIVLDLECKRFRGRDCEDALAAVVLDESRFGKRLHFELEGLPRWKKGSIQVEGRILIPRRLALDLEMGVGEVTLEGLAGDLDVDLGVGEVDLFVARKHLRSIDLDTGVGEVDLRGVEDSENRRSMLVGGEAYWSGGSGTGRVRIDIGVGEIVARVE